MSQVEDFLTYDEEQQIVEAIRKAELQTSGEIRVHLERHADKDIMDRATEVFHWLKMANTADRNGVLIYVAVKDHQFAIIGDKGIHDVVHQSFWDTTRDIIATHFRARKFTKGLIEGITMAGKELQNYFPWERGDINELPDEISKA